VKFVSIPEQRLEGIWPLFLLNDEVSNRYWGRLYIDFADFQFALVDGDELVAEGNCVPVAGQPALWRDAFLAVFERGGEPDRVCARRSWSRRFIAAAVCRA
jgi:hypothetical protein